MEGFKTNNLVEVFPDPLILTQLNNGNYMESSLNLRNLTNEYIIFKIFNNQRSLYSAKPSTSFISPMDTTKISIKRFNKEKVISQPEQGKDKFLLLFYTINKIINNNEEAKEAFKNNAYNMDSKQEAIISIIIKDDNENLEPDYTYNENDINDIGDDYIKGIKVYDDLNENLRKESNKINEKIKEMEKLIDLVKQKKQLNEQDKAMKENAIKKKTKPENYNNIILISILLLGLICGANIAKGYNRSFSKKIIPKNEEIIINKTDYIINKINETNQTKKEEIEINKKLINNTIIDSNESLNSDIDNSNNDKLNKTDINKNETININIPINTMETNNNKLNNTNIDIKEDTNLKTDDKNNSSNMKDKETKKKQKIEDNKNYKNVNKKQNNDFLSFSFLSGIYLCLLELLI